MNMIKLPYYVQAFGAIVAAFNSIADAEDWAKTESSKLTNGWFEVRSTDDNFLYAAFKQGARVPFDKIKAR